MIEDFVRAVTYQQSPLCTNRQRRQNRRHHRRDHQIAASGRAEKVTA